MSIEKPVKKILVVDDHEDMRYSLCELLTIEGYGAMSARDGLEAIRLHAEHRFDLIITDVVMPNASGPEMFKHLRQEKDNTPVIVLTGHPETEDALIFLQGGAASYLRKPADANDLISTVGFLLNKTTNDYKDERRLLFISRNASSSMTSVPDSYITAIVTLDNVYRYLMTNNAGVAVIDPTVEKKDCMELIRRASKTYPFMNIIAYNETLSDETEPEDKFDTVEMKATAKSVFARVYRNMTEQSNTQLSDKINDAFNDRENRIKNAIKKKQDSCAWLITGPRASGKTVTARAISMAFPGLVSVIPTEIGGLADTLHEYGYRYMSEQTFSERSEAVHIANYTHKGYNIGISRYSLERELKRGRDVIIEVPDPEKLAYVKERITSTFAGTKVVTLCLLAQPELLYQRIRKSTKSSLDEAKADLKKFTSLSRSFGNTLWTDSVPSDDQGTTEQDEYREIENTTRLLCAIIRQGRF